MILKRPLINAIGEDTALQFIILVSLVTKLLEWCAGLESTDFDHFHFWGGGDFEMTDFCQFLLGEGFVDFKGLIFYHITMGEC